MWTTSYRNRDGLRSDASGFFVTVEELAQIPLYTPTEALTLAGRQPTPEALAATTLTLETHFDRLTGISRLIPVYATPVSGNLDVDITIAATRPQDLPPIEQPDDED